MPTESSRVSMFRHVIIDSPDRLSDSERELTSFFYFLADEVEGAYIVEMQRPIWSEQDKEFFGTQSWFPEDGQEIVLKEHDKFVYVPWSLYEPGWGVSSGSSFNVGSSFVYTKQKWVQDVTLIKSGISAKTSILLLAAAGLEFAMPNMIFRTPKLEELEMLKDKLHEERESYLSAINDIAKESYDRINSGAYKDAVEWARNESEFRINRKVRDLEVAIKKMNTNILKRLSVDFVKDGVPAIGKALMSEGIVSATSSLAVEVLKILSTSLSRELQYRKAPEASYCLKLKQILKA